jgi:predicted  nucleic acid-binding Zn-ribbon protein
MQIKSDKDFQELQNQFSQWRRRFPMFTHDVRRIEQIINAHIQSHSKLMVLHRQTHNRSYLEKAQLEIDAINKVILTVEKIELMAMLSQ